MKIEIKHINLITRYSFIKRRVVGFTTVGITEYLVERVKLQND